MKKNTEILAEIESAFGGSPKPEHFMNHTHCPECGEHDELLRTRDRGTLKIEDVGNIGWQPISSCTPEGMAYYVPALARLALDEPTYNYGWYGDTLHIHLSCQGKDNKFLRYCNVQQRSAIAGLLRHLSAAFDNCDERLTEAGEFEQCAADWDQSNDAQLSGPRCALAEAPCGLRFVAQPERKTPWDS